MQTNFFNWLDLHNHASNCMSLQGRQLLPPQHHMDRTDTLDCTAQATPTATRLGTHGSAEPRPTQSCEPQSPQHTTQLGPYNYARPWAEPTAKRPCWAPTQMQSWGLHNTVPLDQRGVHKGISACSLPCTQRLKSERSGLDH